MKRIYILLVALFAGIAANAQEIRTVKGIVLDSLTRQPEPRRERPGNPYRQRHRPRLPDPSAGAGGHPPVLQGR